MAKAKGGDAMKIKFLFIALLAVFVLSSSGSAYAEEPETGARVVTKLFRGIANAATGWMEIPKQMSLTWQRQGAGSGLSWGFLKGIGYAVARSAAGGYEMITFPLPVPDEYRPIMKPEYVLSDLPGGGEPHS